MNSYVQTLHAIFCLHILCSVIKSWSFTLKSEIKEKACCFSIFLHERHVAKILTFSCRQRMFRYPFVHYSALFLRSFTGFHYGNLYFFSLHFFPYCTLFILHFFRMAPFACYTFCVVIFSCCTFFRVALFLCIALFDVAPLYVAMFSFFIVLLLHSAHVAIIYCCSLFIFH